MTATDASESEPRDLPRGARALPILPALLRGGVASALTVMALTSAMSALSRGPALWLSALGPLRLWHGLSALAFAALAVAIALELGPRWRRAACALAGLGALHALRDGLAVLRLARAGELHRAGLPLSLILAALFSAAALLALTERRWRPWDVALAGVASLSGGPALLVAFLLCFGATDYRRPAPAAIVLGAAVRRDGTMTLALSDRVAEGVRLYEQGLVAHLVMSGGVGASGYDEAAVMAAAAVAAGVPREAVLLDSAGDNTAATARNSATIARARGWREVLVVSHSYHLARCKEAFRREGLRAYTVPATETRPLRKMPLFVAREVAAWLYYAWP